MPQDGLLNEALCRDVGIAALPIYGYRLVDSTNSEAKRFALQGGAAPAVFVAEEQSAGRGRMGRSFYSPAQTGIYLSLLLEWDAVAAASVGLTAVAAVAVRRAIARVTGVEAQIKWVNDLYAEGRKVCGILAEGFWQEGRQLVVIGVGVNVCTENFPEELKQTAGRLLTDGGQDLRNRLTAQMIRELYETLERARSGRHAEDMQEYRAYSLVLGKPIVYIENGVRQSGVAQSVDDRGRLTVLCEDGHTAVLASGEISLRLQDPPRTINRTGEAE